MVVSQGGFGASTSGAGVKKIFTSIFGVQGNTVNPDLALFPSGKPPVKLPKISPTTKPAPSTLNPDTLKVISSTNQTAKVVKR